MSLNRFDEEGGICGPLITNFIVRDDLIFGFLNLDQSAEFRWLGGFPFPYDLCGRLKQTDEFLRRVQILSEQSRFRLTHHLSHERNHSFQFCTQGIQPQPIHSVLRFLDALFHFFGDPFGLSHDLTGRTQQAFVSRLKFFLTLISPCVAG